MCQAPGMKGLLLCNPRSAQETSTLGTSGLSAPKLSLSTTDKTLNSTDRAGGPPLWHFRA